MTFLIAICIAFLAPPSDHDTKALQATSPRTLTQDSARQHLVAARAAGAVYHIRPALLLAIASHESHYIPTTHTKEPGHRISCGVMTPVPKKHCESYEFTLIGGYDAGAAHLRTWLDHYENREIPALMAYIGGSGLVFVCRRSGVWKTPRGTNACDVAYQFRRMTNVISRALQRGQQS